MRVLFFGTPEFAVPTLRALASSRHTLVGVISQPDRPRGRGRELQPTPVRSEAEAQGLPLLQPAQVGEAEALEWMSQRRPELGVVVAFGQFIPKKVRELPPHGLINGHASLLPRHRGAAPIQHALLCGDEKTGITVIRLVREMDAGDFCLVKETEIREGETAGALSGRLAELCAEAVVEATEQIAAGTAVFRAQDHGAATQAPRIDRSFARLDWGEPRQALLRRIAASTPWPGADVLLRYSGRRFRILEALRGEGDAVTPGRVEAREDGLRIACRDGWIEIRRLQAPGKRPVAAAEFVRGARLAEGEEVVPE
jgi:methionyl-tRNA formyltransferase